jgi:protein SCO1/2
MRYTKLLHWAAASLLALGCAASAEAAGRYGREYFTNVPLVNQDGKTLRFYDDVLKGKAVAINAIYTSCTDTCPLETARLVQLQRVLGDRMGRDIFFYSISIDPEHDTPEVLKAYMAKFGVGPGWQFLTGKPEDIKLVTKNLGLTSITDAYTKDGHRSILMVGNVPAGQWMKHSPEDNPAFLASSLGTFLGWRDPEVARAKSYAEAKPIAMHGGPGEYLFQTRCAACHTVGLGDRTGPDLLGVTFRRDRAWLTRYILEPDRVLASGDPPARELDTKFKGMRMPNLSLGRADAEAIVSYLEMRVTQPSAAPHDHMHMNHDHAHMNHDHMPMNHGQGPMEEAAEHEHAMHAVE